MSDNFEQVKMVTEDAICGLVERAKRLRLNSVFTKEATAQRIPQEPGVGQCLIIDITSTKPSPERTRRIIAAAQRKIRRFDIEPTPSPPPPPSPRERCEFAELRDEYVETGNLIDKIHMEAQILKADMLYCAQHHRDITLVQEIELEATERSMDTVLAALSANLQCDEFDDIMQRCKSSLERFEKRVHIEMPMPMAIPTAIQLERPDDFTRIKEAIDDDLLPTDAEAEAEPVDDPTESTA